MLLGMISQLCFIDILKTIVQVLHKSGMQTQQLSCDPGVLHLFLVRLCWV